MGELLVPGAGGRPIKVNDIASLALEPVGQHRPLQPQRQISLNGASTPSNAICGQRSSGKGR